MTPLVTKPSTLNPGYPLGLPPPSLQCTIVFTATGSNTLFAIGGATPGFLAIDAVSVLACQPNTVRVAIVVGIPYHQPPSPPPSPPYIDPYYGYGRRRLRTERRGPDGEMEEAEDEDYADEPPLVEGVSQKDGLGDAGVTSYSDTRGRQLTATSSSPILDQLTEGLVAAAAAAAGVPVSSVTVVSVTPLGSGNAVLVELLVTLSPVWPQPNATVTYQELQVEERGGEGRRACLSFCRGRGWARGWTSWCSLSPGGCTFPPFPSLIALHPSSHPSSSFPLLRPTCLPQWTRPWSPSWASPASPCSCSLRPPQGKHRPCPRSRRWQKPRRIPLHHGHCPHTHGPFPRHLNGPSRRDRPTLRLRPAAPWTTTRAATWWVTHWVDGGGGGPRWLGWLTLSLTLEGAVGALGGGQGSGCKCWGHRDCVMLLTPLLSPQVLNPSGAYYTLSDTKMRFDLTLNTSYSTLVAQGNLSAFKADLREAVALTFKV